MWGGRAWHVPRIVIQETVQGISVKRVRVERRPLPPSSAVKPVSYWLAYGYRDTTTPHRHAAILQRPRYFLLVRALVRAPPRRPGRSRGRNGDREAGNPRSCSRVTGNGSAWLERSYAAVCGCPVSGAGGESRAPARGRRGGEARARSRPGRRRDKSTSRPRARPPARGRTPPTGTRRVSYFAPRFHSRLKGLSHLRIFIRQYILATPA